MDGPEHLSLWKQRLGTVPEEVWRRTGLRTLVLADNDLAEISEKVGDLGRLRMLDLGHNRLEELPESLGRLDGLSDFLYLHDNPVMRLPESLLALPRLDKLDLRWVAGFEPPGWFAGLEARGCTIYL